MPAIVVSDEFHEMFKDLHSRIAEDEDIPFNTEEEVLRGLFLTSWCAREEVNRDIEWSDRVGELSPLVEIAGEAIDATVVLRHKEADDV